MSALPLKAIGCILPSKTTQPVMVVMLSMVDLCTIALLLPATCTAHLSEHQISLFSITGRWCTMKYQVVVQIFHFFLLNLHVCVCVMMKNQIALMCSPMILATQGKHLPFLLLSLARGSELQMAQCTHNFYH